MSELKDPLAARVALSEEAEEVRRYVMTKKLVRPRTTWLTPAAILLCYAAVCGLGTWGLCRMLSPVRWRTALTVALWLVGACGIARPLCIGLVECYQHYAPEERRRRCLCMPTCSEYALLVLKKDFLPIALCKIRKRLFKTCRDGNYQKDFP